MHTMLLLGVLQTAPEEPGLFLLRHCHPPVVGPVFALNFVAQEEAFHTLGDDADSLTSYGDISYGTLVPAANDVPGSNFVANAASPDKEHGRELDDLIGEIACDALGWSIDQVIEWFKDWFTEDTTFVRPSS